MRMKMNFKSRKCEENGKKVLRYSIRKHHLGVASVAVASVLFFATGVTTVQAAESGPTDTRSTVEHLTPPIVGEERSANLKPEDPAPNYAGTVTFMKQWDVDADDPTIRKDTPREYKTGEDKLGSPAFHSSTANTFLGWSDKPSVDGKIDEAHGARLFSPEDTLAKAFPKGLKPDSKLYGVYTSFTDNEAPVPTDYRRYGVLLNGLSRFEINANKVKIDTEVKANDVLPNTKLKTETNDDKTNTRRIIDEYDPNNNDTTKVNEVVLKAEFEMDNTTAMTVYRNPDAMGRGPVLSNSYKGNKFALDEKKKTYTYVDLNVNLEKGLTIPEKLFVEFNGYSWRPLYALGIKENGEKDKLNILSKDGTNLGNDKNSFNSLVSNTDPKVTFGVETKGYNNITFRMILRSLNEKDSDRPEGERNERIAESAVKPDEGKTIAETIMRNMTLKTLSSTDLHKLFPGKKPEEINKMVIRIAQDTALELAKTNGATVLTVTGSVEGNVHPSAGKMFFMDLSKNLPIKEVKANVLELGYVKLTEPTLNYNPGNGPEHNPEKDPEHKPGKDPEHKPGNDPEHKPGNNPGNTPGSNSEPNPGANPTPSENWNQGSTEVHKQDELPQTGSQQDDWLIALGGLSIIGALTVFPKKREE